MNGPSEHKLSVLERDAADQTLELLSELDVDQAERVLAHVQERLNKPLVEVPAKDQVMFSRGIAGPLGKLICVAKTKIDETTFELFLQRCATQGTDVATMLRDCIYVLVHGKTCGQMIAEKIKHSAQPIEALAKVIGPFGGPESSK